MGCQVLYAPSAFMNSFVCVRFAGFLSVPQLAFHNVSSSANLQCSSRSVYPVHVVVVLQRVSSACCHLPAACVQCMLSSSCCHVAVTVVVVVVAVVTRAVHLCDHRC